MDVSIRYGSRVSRKNGFAMAYKYVFGPVMSGRLGRSLGLDLLGDRICSMDCVYCEVGRTRMLTCERAPYVSAEDILEELSQWKNEGFEPPDFITLGGMGEPCLNTEMLYVIQGSRELFPDVPVAVLTNSTLLVDEQVRRELAEADVVLPSLDSLVNEEFLAMNRPVEGILPDAVANALLEFRKTFTGKIFLEVLLAEGVNDSDENLGRIKDFCKRLKPDRVDVVTLNRPGTVKSIGPVGEAVLSRWREALQADEKAEPKHEYAKAEIDPDRLAELVVASLDRRPQTLEQLSEALEADPDAVRAVLKTLIDEGHAIERRGKAGTFYHGMAHEYEP